MAGIFPLRLVGRPALTSAAVPRSTVLVTWAKMPIGCDDERANQADHDDFQVGGAISAVHRMGHAILPCQTADRQIDLDQTDIVAQSP